MASSKMSAFFSRTKGRNTSDEGRHLAPDNDAASLSTTRSSRHNRDPSVVSIPDRPNSSGSGGLNMRAGVMSAMPYDAMPDRRTPIPVDYLPSSSDMPLRREPLPHHLGSATSDFHQYPSDMAPGAKGTSNSHLSTSSHMSAGRSHQPVAGAANITMATPREHPLGRFLALQLLRDRPDRQPRLRRPGKHPLYR